MPRISANDLTASKKIFSALFFVTVVVNAALFHAACSPEKTGAPVAEMSHAQIDSLLAAVSRKDMTVTERMNFYSGLFLGMAYNFTCVGDGQDALTEGYPLVNFRETNCMALCEHTLAMAISDGWDNFFNNLQQIRYRDGIIGMRTRNHYTMADWLPENGWLLEDVSRKTGGDSTRSVTRTISHRNFFTKKGITDLRYVLPDREITVDYVPLGALESAADRVQAGDILALLYAGKTDIFSAHMLMIAEKDGRKYIRESTTRGMSTFDTRLGEWVGDIQKNYGDTYIGMAVMRVREELNTPGRIVVPWEIPELKEKYLRNR